MLRNYLQVTLRNILRNKLFAAINVIGLSVGIASSVFISMWVYDELSFDTFHQNSARIYRVLQHMPFEEETTWAINQGPLAAGLLSDFDEFENTARINFLGLQFKVEGQEFRRTGLVADKSMLQIFDFAMLSGSGDALDEPNQIILTQSLAEAVFGRTDVVGSEMLLFDRYAFTVGGVIEDPPANSHIQFAFLCPMAFATELGFSTERWNNSTFSSYVLLKEGVSVAEVEAKIKHYLDDKPTLEDGATLSLQPLTSIQVQCGKTDRHYFTNL